MLSILDDLAQKVPEVTFLEVDVVGEALEVSNISVIKGTYIYWKKKQSKSEGHDFVYLQSVAEKLGVKAIPTLMLMKNDEVVDKVSGAVTSELSLKIATHATMAASP